MKKVFQAILTGLLAVSCLGFGSEATMPQAQAQSFVHPGLLHTESDFTRMKTKVAANAQPWKAGWDRLVANPRSSLGWTPRPTATVIRGGTGQNYAQFYPDVHAAYQSALRWKVSGDVAYANKSIDIMNQWSAVLTSIGGNADRFLAAGIYGYQFANAAEIMRTYSGWAPADFARFQNMMLTVFYPMNHDFLVNHNGAVISNYWANWDLCNMASVLAIGVLCDRRDLYNEAITYFKTGGGNGSILKAVPFLHEAMLGQWQESGRDQGHSTMGIGLMSAFCEMAWNQGDDMYGYSDKRFLAGAEYVAKYNLGNDVPFTAYSWQSGQNGAWNTQTVISDAGRGNERPIWEMVYNHYVNRLGLVVPYVTAFATQVRPEGGGGDYGTTSGGFDQLGFGTLTFTREPITTVANGTYRIVAKHSGKVLDVASGSTANGAKIIQWTSTGGTNQQWKVTNIGGGQYSIIGVASGKSLDVNSAGLADGSSLAIWTYSGANNQRFTFTSTGGGYYRITPLHSGKCLDVQGNSTANGANVYQWSYLGGNNQQWSLVPVAAAASAPNS